MSPDECIITLQDEEVITDLYVDGEIGRDDSNYGPEDWATLAYNLLRNTPSLDEFKITSLGLLD